MQTIIVAGEACSADLVSQWGTGRRFFNAYGPTESTVCATVAEAVPNHQSPPIGRAIANTQVYILDAQMQLLPVGVPGELYIGGDGLARGYLNRPDLTRDRFVPNPFSQQPGARLYKTGDLARYLPDGNLEFLGRIDHQVKIRGLRIELGEIEAVLTRHPDIKAAVVMVREDIPKEQRLVAYIVSDSIPDRLPYRAECWVEVSGDSPVKLSTKNISRGGIGVKGLPPCQPGTPVRLRFGSSSPFARDWVEAQIVWCEQGEAGIDFTLPQIEQKRLEALLESLLEKQGFSKVLHRTLAGTLRRYLQDRLPAYMVPSSFLFLNALPLTPNGKVNRKGLPKPEGGQRESEQPYLPPQGEMEQAIASIWQKVLHLEQVGVQDNFFDLGGHSLSMARVHSQLVEVLQTEISMVELFQYPTIAALSEGLRHKQAAVDSQEMPMKESEGLTKRGDRLKESSLSRAQKQKAALERQRHLKQQHKS